ncbi:MAG: hypothetical protein IKC23_02045 [Fibrobacter sp.]|nr:hypothetical protein [Fibrobacter sp.]
MKIKNKFFIKKSLCIREKDIRNLYSILTEFFDSIQLKATVKNGADIDFDSLDELLLFDNMGGKAIRTLMIYAEKRENYKTIQECWIKFNQKCNLWTHALDVNYSFSSSDAEMLFIGKIREYFGKPQEIINRRVVFILVQAIVLIFILIELFIGYHDNIVALILMMFLMLKMIYDMIESFFEKNVSNVIFLWGEEIKAYEKRKSIFSKIFWSVIVAAIVSFAVAKLV